MLVKINERAQSKLAGYFNAKYGDKVGVDHANDLLKSIERIPAEHLSKPLNELKADLADKVMLGGMDFHDDAD